VRTQLVLGLLLSAVVACSGASDGSALTLPGANAGASTGSGSPSSSGGGQDDASSDDLQHCVNVINDYRATLGRAAYTRSSALEDFAAAGAQSDSQTGQAHGHFGSTGGGHGIAFAENEIPGWPGKQYGGLRGVIDGGLKAMWDEGPGGGHYENMSSDQYTSAGCGSFTTSAGDIWVTIDFK
jgi:hypothetical protein